MSRKAVVFSILAALLLFIVLVVARMPAATGLAMVARHSGMVLPYNASGTIWQGKAEHLFIHVNGNMLDLGLTRWQVEPWSLLMGRMQISIDARKGRQKVVGDVTAGIGQTLVLKDFEASFDIASVMAFYPVPFRMQGFAEIMLSEAVLKPGQVAALNGNVVARDLVFNFTHPVELGSYAARLGMEGDAVQADVSDMDAMVAVDGTASVTLAAREYQTDMTLKPAAEADPAIAQTLRALAQPNSDGVFVMQRSGKF